MASKPPPKKPLPAAQPAPGQPMPAQPMPAQPGQPMAQPRPMPAPKPGAPMPAQAAGMTQPGQPGQQQNQEGGEEEIPSGGNRFILFNAVPSWLVSMVVHAIMLLVLAMFSFSNEIENLIHEVVSEKVEDEQEELESFEIEEIEELDVTDFENTFGPESVVQPLAVETPTPDNFDAADIEAAPVNVELTDFSSETAPKTDLLTELGAVQGTGVSGRGSAMRGDMVKRNGGTEGSEKAVAAALRWLAQHQVYPQGNWNFDHRVCVNCAGKCNHAGTLTSAPRAATGMALMPFLGAGQTHQEGTYKKEVGTGLDFLVASQKADGGFNEPGGSMYGHGICAITLCEAYAMTQDKRLILPAQGSLNFIVNAQDPVGGGWRYSPRQAGDTSAVGWQLMALKSGHMGYLQVPPNVIRGAVKFLDSVSAESGAYYGYTGPGQGQATTAVGLLSRMYLGWDQDNPALGRGVEFLAKKGPSIGEGRANMYYNYYATQVLRHFDDKEKWKAWNEKMRDFLVESQDKSGHMTGSWAFKGDHGAERGGRLYCTSMATMVLEVYYRHMPIYGKAAAKEDFPL